MENEKSYCISFFSILLTKSMYVCMYVCKNVLVLMGCVAPDLKTKKHFEFLA